MHLPIYGLVSVWLRRLENRGQCRCMGLCGSERDFTFFTVGYNSLLLDITN